MLTLSQPQESKFDFVIYVLELVSEIFSDKHFTVTLYGLAHHIVTYLIALIRKAFH